uniref:PID domain-containing protein n=1 Tax=Neogobius melanostomus TaxID=47308 RepID=A0A8C6T078_9GOBI
PDLPSGVTQWERPRHTWGLGPLEVRALGWMQVLEEDLGPGRSSLAVSHVIQQLSHCQSQDPSRTQSRTSGSSGSGQEMKLVLKKDSLILLDPLDHTPLHCQPISNIRVWAWGATMARR